MSFQLKDNIFAKDKLFPSVAHFRQVSVQISENTPAVAVIIVHWTTFTAALTCEISIFPAIGYHNFKVLEFVVALCAM